MQASFRHASESLAVFCEIIVFHQHHVCGLLDMFLYQHWFLDFRDYSYRGVPELFVQTDKFVYKPGQLVRFRIFSVDADLRPVTEPVRLIYTPVIIF